MKKSYSKKTILIFVFLVLIVSVNGSLTKASPLNDGQTKLRPINVEDVSVSYPESILLTSNSCPDPFEPNDTIEQAWAHDPGVIQSYICDQDDQDYFSFAASAGTTMSLDLYDLPADYDLCLYDPSGKLMRCSRQTGKDSEQIVEEIIGDGNYTVFVHGVQGQFNMDSPYTLGLHRTGPDLSITGFWEDNQQVCFQLLNSGNMDAVQGHFAELYLDGQVVDATLVSEDMAPSERLNTCFTSTWQCQSAPEDTVRVCADVQDSVLEEWESNNCRQEVWQCDTEAPVITEGPTVSTITTDSVVVHWVTNESSDATLYYGAQAGSYAEQVHIVSYSEQHEVTLSNLQSSTTYHFMVESKDISGNTVQSEQHFFETEAIPDTQPPQVSQITYERGDGDTTYFTISAQSSDNDAVERVEFFIDDELIGTDYSGDDGFETEFVPVEMGLTHQEAYSSHNLRAIVYDMNGGVGEETMTFTPVYEPPFIEMFFETPGNSLYIEGGMVPAGTQKTLRVTAKEIQCRSGGIWVEGNFHRDENLDCEHSVNRVEFYINGNLYTYVPEYEGIYNFYHTWDLSGYIPGTYEYWARVVASDGIYSLVTPRKTLTIEWGERELQVTRNVNRVGNYFEVELVLENEGTLPIDIDYLTDNVTRFQPIGTESNIYRVGSSYDPASKKNDVLIDLFQGSEDFYRLNMGASLEIEYQVVPIFYSFHQLNEYAIGDENIEVYGPGISLFDVFDRPGGVTTDGHLLADEVHEAHTTSDYLVLTDARRLFDHYIHPDVYELLSTMAELAWLKNGVLADDGWPDPETVLRIGMPMRGSDGIEGNFLSNGYLLIVGETEIVRSGEVRVSAGSRSFNVHYSDLIFANTNDDSLYTPELRVGRIIGNNAFELMEPLKTSIEVYTGFPYLTLFDRSHALAVAGRGEGVSRFEEDVDNIADRLDDEFYDVEVLKQRAIESSGGDPTTEFITFAPNRDVIFYRDHCSGISWSGFISTTTFITPPGVDFENGNPFGFACCCRAGQYDSIKIASGTIVDTGIAETFLTNGAGIYIGSTENSFRDANSEACTSFYDNWVGHTNPASDVLTSVKRRLSGYSGMIWKAEYNFYGDPKYDIPYLEPSVSSLSELVSSASLDDEVTLVIPDYEIDEIEDEDYVSIPDGGFYIVLNKPLVPKYSTDFHIPEGLEVQRVTMNERSGRSMVSGLNLPTVIEAWDSSESSATTDGNTIGVWPNKVYDWRISENPDGTSILTIVVYPFFYDPATTNAEFFSQYIFDIDYMPTNVAIDFINTNEQTYAQGADVKVDFWISNKGNPQDIILSANILAETSGESIDGLQLRTLKQLVGKANYSAQWSSDKYPVGNYLVEVEVRDKSGAILDRATKRIILGSSSIEVDQLTVDPPYFNPDATTEIDMTFDNIGTEPVDGTAIIKIQDPAGNIVEQFSQSFADLAIDQSLTLHMLWDMPIEERNSYNIIGYVLFDSKSTDPIVIYLPDTNHKLYLPVVLSGER